MFSIERMCNVLEISRAGFYAWRKRPESDRKREDKRLTALIKRSFKQSRDTYGYRRICKDLHVQQETCGEKRIARLMKEHEIRPKTRRKFRVTTNSKHNQPIHDNLLQRQFHAGAPNQRWVSDISVPQQAA
jgi:putative transposase